MLFQIAEHRAQNTEHREDVSVEEFTPEELLRMEKEMLGIYVSSHPLEYVNESLEAQVKQAIADISEMREGEEVRIGGLLSSCRKITTRKGDLMMVGNIEDRSGEISLVVFPKTFARCAEFCNNDQVVVVKGKVNRDMRTDEYNVVAEELTPMEEMEKKRFLHIELVGVGDAHVLSKMKETLLAAKGEDPIFIRMDGKVIELGGDFKVDINPDLISDLEKILGSGSVKVEFRAVKKEKAPAEVSF